MSVRTWVTLSVAALFALGVASAYRFLSPLQPPAIIVSAVEGRPEGVAAGSCWPQRNGALACDRPARTPSPPRGPALPASGSLRLVVAWPTQPERGAVILTRRGAGDPQIERGWTERLAYDLEPGAYVLRAEARYPRGAFVRYVFGFTVPG